MLPAHLGTCCPALQCSPLLSPHPARNEHVGCGVCEGAPSVGGRQRPSPPPPPDVTVHVILVERQDIAPGSTSDIFGAGAKGAAQPPQGHVEYRVTLRYPPQPPAEDDFSKSAVLSLYHMHCSCGGLHHEYIMCYHLARALSHAKQGKNWPYFVASVKPWLEGAAMRALAAKPTRNLNWAHVKDAHAGASCPHTVRPWPTFIHP